MWFSCSHFVPLQVDSLIFCDPTCAFLVVTLYHYKLTVLFSVTQHVVFLQSLCTTTSWQPYFLWPNMCFSCSHFVPLQVDSLIFCDPTCAFLVVTLYHYKLTALFSVTQHVLFLLSLCTTTSWQPYFPWPNTCFSCSHFVPLQVASLIFHDPTCAFLVVTLYHYKLPALFSMTQHVLFL